MMTRTFLLLAFLLPLIGCGVRSVDHGTEDSTTRGATLTPDDPQVMAALASFNRGNALMEQYRYGDAAAQYEKVGQAYPDWIAAVFNLGLAYLNLQGESGCLFCENGAA